MFHGDSKLAELEYVKSDDNKADLFTKQFEKPKFEVLRECVGVRVSEPAIHAGEGGVERDSAKTVAAPCMKEFACWCLERDCETCCHKYLSVTAGGSSFPV
eukprot:2135107-Amphidinium_carterae.1